MNKYSILVGFCYAAATPLGVHIGIMFANYQWLFAFLELGLLTLINLLAPFFWIRAQSIEIIKNNPNMNDQSILDSISEIEDFTKGMDYDHFKNDKKTILAVIMELDLIVEAIKKILRKNKYKNAEAPLKDILKIREKIFHKYFGIDLNTLWGMIQKNLPLLKSAILNNSK